LAIGYLPTLNSKESSASAGYQWKSREKKRHLPQMVVSCPPRRLEAKVIPPNHFLETEKRFPVAPSTH